MLQIIFFLLIRVSHHPGTLQQLPKTSLGARLFPYKMRRLMKNLTPSLLWVN
jgi:hypothetical protein